MKTPSKTEFTRIQKNAGALFFELANAKTMSFSRLAQELGLSRSTLHRILSGHGCSRLTALRFLDWLDSEGLKISPQGGLDEKLTTAPGGDFGGKGSGHVPLLERIRAVRESIGPIDTDAGEILRELNES